MTPRTEIKEPLVCLFKSGVKDFRFGVFLRCSINCTILDGVAAVVLATGVLLRTVHPKFPHIEGTCSLLWQCIGDGKHGIVNQISIKKCEALQER